MGQMVNAALRYLDLFSNYRGSTAVAQGIGSNKTAVWRQAVIYLCCVVGVICGPYVPDALNGDPPSLALIFGDWNRVGWSLVVGLAALPAGYKLIFSPKNLLIVQCGFALVVGFVAQKLIPAVIALVLKA